MSKNRSLLSVLRREVQKYGCFQSVSLDFHLFSVIAVTQKKVCMDSLVINQFMLEVDLKWKLLTKPDWLNVDWNDNSVKKSVELFTCLYL